jgi:hypothetical protein
VGLGCGPQGTLRTVACASEHECCQPCVAADALHCGGMRTQVGYSTQQVLSRYAAGTQQVLSRYSAGAQQVLSRFTSYPDRGTSRCRTTTVGTRGVGSLEFVVRGGVHAVPCCKWWGPPQRAAAHAPPECAPPWRPGEALCRPPAQGDSSMCFARPQWVVRCIAVCLGAQAAGQPNVQPCAQPVRYTRCRHAVLKRADTCCQHGRRCSCTQTAGNKTVVMRCGPVTTWAIRTVVLATSLLQVVCAA